MDLSFSASPSVVTYNAKPIIINTSRSHLLALPPELRNRVYSAALLDETPNLALLQTCRQINMEARSNLYHRHISFSSHQAFFRWIENSRSTNLKSVHALTLQIIDVDLSTLFDFTPHSQHDRSCASNGGHSAWSLYQRDLHRLDHSLQALPLLTELIIIPPPSYNHSQLLRGMYLSFLALITQRYPKLRPMAMNSCADDALVDHLPSKYSAVMEPLPTIRFCTIVSKDSKLDSTGPSISPSKQNESNTRPSYATSKPYNELPYRNKNSITRYPFNQERL